MNEGLAQFCSLGRQINQPEEENVIKVKSVFVTGASNGLEGVK
jgi:hypothetical protein